jgi:capsular polysaccharide biosynthesis protein
MTLRDIIRVLWRRRLLLAAAAAVAVVLALVVVVSQGRRYRSDTRVLLSQPQAASPGTEGQATVNKLVLEAVTFAKLVSAPGFVADSARQAGINPGDATVSGDTPVNSTLLQVGVTSSSRATSEAVGAAVVRGLVRIVDQGQQALPDDEKSGLVVVQQPRTAVASTNPVFVLFVALIAALAIASTIALLLEGP